MVLNGLACLQPLHVVIHSVGSALRLSCQPACRLTCTRWRDQLAAQTLCHRVTLPSIGDWKQRASSLKTVCPRVTVALTASGSSDQLPRLLQSSEADVVVFTVRLDSGLAVGLAEQRQQLSFKGSKQQSEIQTIWQQLSFISTLRTVYQDARKS